MIRNITLLCIALLLPCGGCEAASESASLETASSVSAPSTATEPAVEAPSVSATTVLLHNPAKLIRYEFPSQALQQWYALRSARPALLLYSNDPLLQSTTPAMQKNLLVRLANHDQVALRFDIADPAILPKMTLHAALEAGLFSAVYWVMPTREEAASLSIDIFRTQMVQLGALSDEEARALTLREGIFSGTVRGVPFHALHPQSDFAISGPVAFHFDLSYLSPLYKGEIKTPVYPLIYQTLKHLRDQRVETLSTSFSYSQISGEIPLGSRFVGDVFEQLFNQPKMLDENLSEAWQKRANALYLPEMFMASDARNILLQLVEAHPDDPSLHFALYQVSREVRSARHTALDHLADAVQRDPVYALEYLLLAPIAREKGHPDEALRMLRLAHEGYTDNPFIALELARALLSANHGDGAVPLLQQLLVLNWSLTIYPDMPEFLQQLLTEANSQKSTENSRQQ